MAEQVDLITPATYSGVHVLQQADTTGQPVMRRAHDDYINATQVLRAAGFPKTQRTKILERDISGGVHEKVQGGFHMFQGTWVPLETAIRLARKHGVNDLLTPLFSYSLNSGAQSEIFKSIGKFVKPYRIPRAKVDPRPASTRLAGSSNAPGGSSLFDSEGSSDTDDIEGEGDEGDVEDEEDEEGTSSRIRKQRVSNSTPPPSSSQTQSTSDTNESSPPPPDQRRARKPGPMSASPKPASALLAVSPPPQDAINNNANGSASAHPSNSNSSTSPSPQPPSQQLLSAAGPSSSSATPATTPVVKRGPGRPKGSKNNAGRANSGSPAPPPSSRRNDSSSSLATRGGGGGSGGNGAEGGSPEREGRSSSRPSGSSSSAVATTTSTTTTSSTAPATSSTSSSNNVAPSGRGRGRGRGGWGRGRGRGSANSGGGGLGRGLSGANAERDDSRRAVREIPVVLGPEALREKDTMELMDPYGVLNPSSMWSDEEDDIDGGDDDGGGAGGGGDDDESIADDEEMGPSIRLQHTQPKRSWSHGFDDAMSEVSSVEDTDAEGDACSVNGSGGGGRRAVGFGSGLQAAPVSLLKRSLVAGSGASSPRRQKPSNRPALPVASRSSIKKRLIPCASCGALTQARWKRRNGGNSSLCDLCGLKWCFGKQDSSTGGSGNQYLSGEDFSDEEEEGSSQMNDWKMVGDSDDEMTNSTMIGNNGACESAEVRKLRWKLDESEKSGKKLRKLLEAVKREDAKVDRAFRRTIIWCRRVKQGILKPVVDDKENNDDNSDDDESGEGGAAVSLEEDGDSYEWSQETVNSFVGTVLAKTSA